jgi:hypothetical protein
MRCCFFCHSFFLQVMKGSAAINCESCGAPCDAFAGLNFCSFCKAPLTIARRKQNRTRGKLTEVFSKPPSSPGGDAQKPVSPRPSSPRGGGPPSPRIAVAKQENNSCPSCNCAMLAGALFCTKVIFTRFCFYFVYVLCSLQCGTNVSKTQSQFCGLCSATKVSAKSGAALVCPSCEPELAGQNLLFDCCLFVC